MTPSIGLGTKFLQLVNTPELNVFNGDMGEIVGITFSQRLRGQSGRVGFYSLIIMK